MEVEKHLQLILLRERDIRKESNKEKGTTSRLIELQTVVQLVDPSFETPSEGNETMQQSETTIEQPTHTPMSEIEIKQIVHP